MAAALGISEQLVSYHTTSGDAPPVNDVGAWIEFLAVNGREVMVVQSLAFVILMIVLVMNFLMDVAYGILDPRIADCLEALARVFLKASP